MRREEVYDEGRFWGIESIRVGFWRVGMIYIYNNRRERYLGREESKSKVREVKKKSRIFVRIIKYYVLVCLVNGVYRR